MSTNNSSSPKSMKSTMKRNGYFSIQHICDTLQGSIWSSTQHESKQEVIIKSTNKGLHRESSVIMNGQKYHVHENIFKERAYLKYLTTQNAPKSIVKYIDFFQDDHWWYLVMENGGQKLFDFVTKAHNCIKCGTLPISEWHRVCRILFKQMLTAIEYMHEHNVSHFDISLENILINSIDILISPQNQHLTFVTDDKHNEIQIKICDFGLAEMFEMDHKNGDTSNKYCGKRHYKSPEIVAKQENFSAFANDIWCLGVTLFMMIVGAIPWKRAEVNDNNFRLIMNGKIMKVLRDWGRNKYVDHDIIDLLSSIFKYENERISVLDLKKHKWLNQ